MLKPNEMPQVGTIAAAAVARVAAAAAWDRADGRGTVTALNLMDARMAEDRYFDLAAAADVLAAAEGVSF